MQLEDLYWSFFDIVWSRLLTEKAGTVAHFKHCAGTEEWLNKFLYASKRFSTGTKAIDHNDGTYYFWYIFHKFFKACIEKFRRNPFWKFYWRNRQGVSSGESEQTPGCSFTQKVCAEQGWVEISFCITRKLTETPSMRLKRIEPKRREPMREAGVNMSKPIFERRPERKKGDCCDQSTNMIGTKPERQNRWNDFEPWSCRLAHMRQVFFFSGWDHVGGALLSWATLFRGCCWDFLALLFMRSMMRRRLWENTDVVNMTFPRKPQRYRNRWSTSVDKLGSTR